MAQTNSKANITEKIKEIDLTPVEVENDAYIVQIEGWRMRIYFDEGHEVNRSKVTVKYTGNIKNPHTVKFEKVV